MCCVVTIVLIVMGLAIVVIALVAGLVVVVGSVGLGLGAIVSIAQFCLVIGKKDKLEEN